MTRKKSNKAKENLQINRRFSGSVMQNELIFLIYFSKIRVWKTNIEVSRANG